MKLQKSNLADSHNCRNMKCTECGMSDFYGGYSAVTCLELVSDTALQLLERVETAETILRDILSSGNVGACRKEIEEFLKEDNKNESI